MKTLLTYSIAIILISFTFSSCKIDKVAPGDALGPNFPSIINTVITPTLLDTLTKNGVVINSGLTPPTVNGIYLLSPNYCIFDNSGNNRAGQTFYSYKYQFSNQNNASFAISIAYSDAIGGGTDLGLNANNTYISGSGNLFTVFTKITATDEGITYTELKIISGEIEEGGINNLQVSDYWENIVNDPTHLLVPAGTNRIFKDQDGVSETQSTFSVTGKQVPGIGESRLKSILSEGAR